LTTALFAATFGGRKQEAVSSKGLGMVLNENDRELIEACQRGEQDAFAVLFEANKDKVYSLALRYSGDPAVAMDIAQETFLKLLSSIQRFRSDASFETWLYRLVVNSCLDYQRRRRRLAPLVDGLLDAMCSARDTVLQRLVREEQETAVQRVIGKLPPEQRIVVILRYTEDLPYEHIAEILGCSTGTVASRLNRAHKVLERRLAHLRREEGFRSE
jgi:RNA polymerase sigma-70 factor, ECF subfamily